MKIEYAGLKPVIDEHGISFKDGKEDKYKYLKYAMDILIAIDHPYKDKEKYSHNIPSKRITSDEILDILKLHHPDIDETMETEIKNYKKHLDEEELEVNNRKKLSEIEKNAFINNLKIMRNYKIQRAMNKIFYFHCIETIVETIIDNKIKILDTPFNERFWHILQTIQGDLSKNKISTNLSTQNINGDIKAELIINIY